ncbi:hypothetical protein vBBceHLY2_00070 [Bacillus phage vB_BceH_LY2]|nr:hypothetical protein vBBceHLY2_00070 [Bacillus phage vB_BceH_LY2]
MEGVGLIVYYEGVLYYSEWCTTLEEAFNKYYKEVANQMLDDTEIMDLDFDWVVVKMIYNYDKFMSEIGEVL